MALSAYHEKYRRRSDDEIARRMKVKEAGLSRILDATGFRPAYDSTRVAVLGCGERRLVGGQRAMFVRLFGAPVEQSVFDVDIEHLEGEAGVFRHDVTEPLPGGPFDLAYADVLLKFIPEGKRLDAVMNAYAALRAPGLAVFILDDADGLPIARLRQELEAKGLRSEAVPITIEGVETVVISETALVLLK